jgi:hypothetical protein
LPSLDHVREYEAKKESYIKSSMKEFLKELKQGKRKDNALNANIFIKFLKASFLNTYFFKIFLRSEGFSRVF